MKEVPVFQVAEAVNVDMTLQKDVAHPGLFTILVQLDIV